MADSTRPRVALIDDHAPTITALVRALRAGAAEPPTVQVHGHSHALTTEDWSGVDRVLVAAWRHGSVQAVDPTAPLLAGPDVVAHVSRCRPDVPVIAYGARAARPEVQIILRQAGAVAVYEEQVLRARLREVLDGDSWPGQVLSPTPEDFAALGLEPDADLWAAVRLMRRVRPRDRFPHGDAWERLAQTEPNRKIDDRTREYINDRVAPLLGITGWGRHRRVTELLGSILGLPAPLGPRGPTDVGPGHPGRSRDLTG